MEQRREGEREKERGSERERERKKESKKMMLAAYTYMYTCTVYTVGTGILSAYIIMHLHIQSKYILCVL